MSGGWVLEDDLVEILGILIGREVPKRSEAFLVTGEGERLFSFSSSSSFSSSELGICWEEIAFSSSKLKIPWSNGSSWGSLTFFFFFLGSEAFSKDAIFLGFWGFSFAISSISSFNIESSIFWGFERIEGRGRIGLEGAGLIVSKGLLEGGEEIGIWLVGCQSWTAHILFHRIFLSR